MFLAALALSASICASARETDQFLRETAVTQRETLRLTHETQAILEADESAKDPRMAPLLQQARVDIAEADKAVADVEKAAHAAHKQFVIDCGGK